MVNRGVSLGFSFRTLARGGRFSFPFDPGGMVWKRKVLGPVVVVCIPVMGVGPVGVFIWSTVPALCISWSSRGGDLRLVGGVGEWLISSSMWSSWGLISNSLYWLAFRCGPLT